MQLNWLTEDSRTFLNRGYLRDGQTIEERYQEICDTIVKISKDVSLGKRFENYIEKGWISFATPVLSNFGSKNLPISCNKSVIGDNLDSILNGQREIGMLSKYGAGTAVNFSDIRPAGSPISSGGTSEGIIPFISMYDHTISKITQGSQRRGMMCAYLSVSHKEILDFLEIGSEGSSIQTITTAVTIPKGWMDSLKQGDLEKRKIWSKVLKTRSELGFPYILFEENCNKNKPQVYKDKGYWINHSNLCSECLELCTIEKTFACCLSSVNALHFDDWVKDPNFIFDVNLMLDCVLSEYIEKGDKLAGLGRAIRFAKEHRAIGVGVLGFHSYLQKRMIPFGSIVSKGLNKKIFSHIRAESDRASKWMAENWGEPEYMKGYGLRNSSRIAVAPTKSTAFIMGSLSSGIEPIKSNYHIKSLAKIQHEYKNPLLVNLLDSKNKNTSEVWEDILNNNGSVQSLDFLSQNEKDVFKTFSEISQLDIVQMAADRQEYIDQGQSLNLMFHPSTTAKQINKLTLKAYDLGIKTLYYQYSGNAAQEFSRSLLECTSCEG